MFKHNTLLLALLVLLLAIVPAAAQDQDSLVLDDFEEDALAFNLASASVGFVAWGDQPDNVTLDQVTVAPADDLARPNQTDTSRILQITYDSGGWGGFTHAFTEDGTRWDSQDWRAYDAMQFWLYGNATDGIVQVEIFDNRAPGSESDTAERWFFRITDDYEGWMQFTIPFSEFQRRTDFQPGGAPDDGLGLDQVSGYAFGMPVGTGEQVAYLDELTLLTGVSDFLMSADGTSPLAAEEEPELPPPPADALFRDPNASIDERVEDLLSYMTLAEKIGQMTLVEKNAISPQEVTERYIGGVLSGGGGSPAAGNTPELWAAMVREFQQAALATRLGIPLIYGVDAVHGHSNVIDATIFPHNIGLGAAGDADLVRRIGEMTARDMLATNIHWNYAPVLAVLTDPRWGRYYEGYGETTELVTELGIALQQGLQGTSLADPRTVLATPKHYVADGAAAWGTSTTGDYQIDQGDAQISEDDLRALHLPPYAAAIENNAQSIMASYSSWNGVKMHGNGYLMTDVLRGELGFEGFIVSDWAGIDQIPGPYRSDVITSVNAGIDMNMVPTNYALFIRSVQQAVENGEISMERIDDAVRNILRVKFALGLFENPHGDESLLASVGDAASRDLAREAVQKSQVLLQNRNSALPIARDARIFIGGPAADNLGIQSGGWTIEWQGVNGNPMAGTTIREAIQATASGEVFYSPSALFSETAAVGIAVIGERPYAEGIGDDPDLALTRQDRQLLERMRAASDTLVVVLLTGRPLVLDDVLDVADAVVVAWLPGTEGQGIADTLFGDVEFSGTLPVTWMRSVDQLPFDLANIPADGCAAPLYPRGYGLTTATPESDQILPLDCETLASDDLTPANTQFADVEWELVWSDEFNAEAMTPINSDNWTCEVGGWGWGNGELQYYTESGNAWHDGAGNLVIEARETRAEDAVDAGCWYGDCRYTSARCITMDKVELAYGRVEARIQVPQGGQGIWPAFWMLGARFPEIGWPTAGEIDIMEFIGSEPYTIHGTVHGPGYSGGNGVGASISNLDPIPDDFREFAIEWSVDGIDWYLDGELYHSVTPRSLRPNVYVFVGDYFLLLNVAVGGAWPGDPDESTPFPQHMLVDYVRWYQPAQ